LYKTKELTAFDIPFFIHFTKFKMNHVCKVKRIQLKNIWSIMIASKSWVESRN